MIDKYSNKFSIRVDVDTSDGMAEGMPKLLEIFDRYDIHANIYVVMGPDKNFHVLRKRFGLVKAVYNLAHGLPKYVARNNPKVVDLLLQGKHFLSPHGWDHQKYCLMRLTQEEKKSEFDQAVAEFIRVFGFKPASYLFPCDKIDADGIAFATEHEMKYMSYNPHSFTEARPYWENGIFFLPILPFYDGDMIFRHDTDEKILKLYLSYVDMCLEHDTICSIAIHPCQIGSKDNYLVIVDKLLAYVRSKGMENLTINRLAEL